MYDSIYVKPATSRKEMDAVYRLVHDTFVARGILEPQANGRLMNNLALDRSPDTTIFVAYWGEEIVGTISFTVHDTPEKVYNYKVFKDALDENVDKDARSFSGWRMATTLKNPRMQPMIAMRLVAAVHKHSFEIGVRQSYLSFVSQHTGFYQKLLMGGQIIDKQHKKTEFIDGDLSLMSYTTNQMVYHRLEERASTMEASLLPRLRKVA